MTPARSGPLLREAATDSTETRHQPGSAPSPATHSWGLPLKAPGILGRVLHVSLPTLSLTLVLFHKSDQPAILKVAVSQGLVKSSQILSVTKTRSAEDKTNQQWWHHLELGCEVLSRAGGFSVFMGIFLTTYELRLELCGSLYRQRLPEISASSFVPSNTSISAMNP